MSATVNIAGGVSARSGVMYALYGRGQQYVDNMKRGTNRAAAYASSMESPEEFIAYAEEMAAAHGRKYETYNLVLAGDPKVFDVNRPEDLKKMLGLSVGLAEAAFSAEYLVVIHDDSKGEHVHGHIYVVNHDECTGKALKRNTSWTRGLRQLNDELLVEAGYEPNADPQRPKLDWELRREEFKPGGFEQALGDLVYESLADPRCVDRPAFEQVLEENGVRLKVTDRDGWTYSMRRDDNGKWGRKKASALTPEFTAEGAQQIFEYHAQKGVTNGVAGHDEAGRRAAVDYGNVGGVDLEAARRRTAALEVDEDRGRPHGLRESDGRAAGGPAEASVDLAAARAALEAAARRRDEEQDRRDREDARRRRIAAEQQRSREAARRVVSAPVGLGCALDDDEDREAARDDGPEFG